MSIVRDLLSNMHVATIIPMSTIISPILSADKTGKGKLPGSSIEFLAKALAYNTAASAIQLASVGVEAIVAELLFLMGKFWYYKFPINPQNFSLNNNKLQTIEETSDLTIINTYRNASPPMSFKGVSGCTMNRFFLEKFAENSFPTDLGGALARYPKLSAAYLKFRQLEKFYNEINSDIVIMYDMDIYVGKFTSFNFNQDANNPWIINYDMNFRLYPGMTLHTYSIYDYKPFFKEMLNRYGTTFATDFEGKSKTEKT